MRTSININLYQSQNSRGLKTPSSNQSVKATQTNASSPDPLVSCPIHIIHSRMMHWPDSMHHSSSVFIQTKNSNLYPLFFVAFLSFVFNFFGNLLSRPVYFSIGV